MARHDAGYTLTELVVVILIFGIVMTLISASFSRIISSSGQIAKSVETDIGGLIGLELLRIDLGFAGYGLPWSVDGATYSGEAGSHKVNGNPNTEAADFNDGSSDPPRAFVMQNDGGFNGSDYLVLKGTALNTASRSRGNWSYLGYSSTGAVMKRSASESELEMDRDKRHRVIVINSGARGGLPFRDLVTNGSSFHLDLVSPLPAAFEPRGRQDSYLLYAIAPPPEDSEDKVTFPFNRADYFLGLPETPSSNCAPGINGKPGTGSLYRGAVSQNGHFSADPILDCVADLQVIFRLDTSSDGTPVPQDLDAYSAALKAQGKDVAKALREQVKEVRVYILAQQGKMDSGYSYPAPDPDRVIVVGDPELGSVWKRSDLEAKFGPGWRHYRWKVYTIAVQPKNLD